MAEYGPAGARAVAPAIFQESRLNVGEGYRHQTGLAISMVTLDAIGQFLAHGPAGFRSADGVPSLLDFMADWTGAARYLGDAGVRELGGPALVAVIPAPGGALVGRAYGKTVTIRSYLPGAGLSDARHDALASAPAPERSLILGEVDDPPVPEQIAWMFETDLLFAAAAGDPPAIVAAAGDPHGEPAPVLLATELVGGGVHEHG